MTTRSDAWLTGRARELLAQIQVCPPERQPSFIPLFDELLAEAKRRGEGWMLGNMLRVCAIAALMAPSTVQSADPMIDALLAHSRRHGLLVLQAGAHALRGLRALLASGEDAALTEVAQALAMLDERQQPDALVNRRDWYRSLSATLADIALVLTRLGMYEDAEPVLTRARRAIANGGGGPHEIVVQLVNQITLLLSWGLHLERIGDERGAAGRFSAAAEIVATVEHPYTESLFTRDAARSAVAQVPELAAAAALARPDACYINDLYAMMTQTAEPSYLIVMTVALSRCLERDGRASEALSVLIDTRDRLADDRTEHTLRLALSREYARLCGPEPSEQTTNALELYVAELESELWNRRSSQISSLAARREHERLSREHGTVTKQAMQDPLTGLPNRRALDERLDALTATGGAQPLSIALIDLDGFKGVNDRRSHADGDDVLRVIASTVRDTLRGGDLVARYGGDEFVALLPGAPLTPATAALQRAVDAVGNLPSALSHGVTLSVGIVTMMAHESTGSALARADAAMYQAKRCGGNRVACNETGASETAAESEAAGEGDGERTDGGGTWVLPDTP